MNRNSGGRRACLSRLFLLGLLTAAAAWPQERVAAPEEGFNGRWIIAPKEHPAGRVLWLSIEGAGSSAISGFAVGGSAGEEVDPIVDAAIEDGVLTYRVERPLGRGETRRTESTRSHARPAGGELHGATRSGDPEIEWIGRRAPVIADRDDGSWREGGMVDLLSGESVEAAWAALRPGRESEWLLRDGVLRNSRQADILVSKEKFWNFRLHAEYRIAPGADSGIGLRGRYEIQIADDRGRPPSKAGSGALRGRIAPSANAAKPAESLQTLAVTLIGRDLTVVLNGRKVIDKATVEGFTALATDWREAEPGPLTLQGDRGAVEFRKLVVFPLKP